MKKHMHLICTVLALSGFLAGCGEKADTPNNPLPTEPLLTIPPAITMPQEDETIMETYEETVSPTIEDGNGPIPSQQTGR